MLAPIETADAVVDAHAFPDVLDTTLIDLLREEWIGDRLAGRSDDVDEPGLHCLGHQVGHCLGHQVGTRPSRYPDDGLFGGLSDAREEIHVVSFGDDPRRADVATPIKDGSDVEIPEVD